MPDIHEVVSTICLAFPEATETSSHGSPDYKVRDKSFATFTVNHHGDGRLGLLLNASKETQQMYVESAPNIFFVPPYVGTKGWVGIELSAGMRWERVSELVRDAYQRVAPASLAKQATSLTSVTPPDTVDIKEIDPFFFPENQALLGRLRDICLEFPEAAEDSAFGNPTFKAGKKTFCHFNCHRGVPSALFRVGVDRQPALTMDARFTVPAYMGHNGWISVRLDTRFDDTEVRALAEDSYRHFALKRMLKVLEEG